MIRIFFPGHEWPGRKVVAVIVLAVATSGIAAGPVARRKPMENQRQRCRELGITIGVLPTGPLNAITDVSGVRVGHQTLVEGEAVRTGVTAVLPHGDNIFQQKVPAAVVVGNGFGKLVGVTQIRELGLLESPIVLTNTLSTFMAADAVVAHTLKQSGNEKVRSINPVVGECNDGYLNDIRAQRVTAADVVKAISEARTGVVAEGCVGAGTGTRCMGWKGGMGTASRQLPQGIGGYTVGVLVQTNFNGILSVNGAPVGRKLGRYYLKELKPGEQDKDRGSCMVVVATNAPVDARQLGRLGKRALLGLAAVGSPMTHGSGDYVISFSSEPGLRTTHTGGDPVEQRPRLRDDALSPLFQAVKEATEEAVLNSIFMATTTRGFRGRELAAIPLERVVEICREHGVLGK
ncbi:MAG: P1 family peptidase [Pirellulaceae bacterium]